MSNKLRRFLRYLLDVKRDEVIKVCLLTFAFFLVIGAYTIAKELKDAIFTTIVGPDRRYQSYAKMLSMLILIPTLMFHSHMVDILKRHYLLYFYATLYGIIGLIFALLLGHPEIGLANTVSSPTRLFGWLFYFFIEGYSPLVVSVFWAFANSVTSPESAKNNYTVMIAGSKCGGILTATTCWFLLRQSYFSDVVNHQILLGFSSLILLFVPLAIFMLVSFVPKSDMHGYEAAYKVDRAHRHSGVKTPWISGMLSGLTLLFKYPYVMGIFAMSFFFELVNQAIKVENIIFGKAISSTISEFTAFLLWQSVLVHAVGLLVVVFGTRALLEALGEKRSLMLVPTITGLSIIGFVFRPSYFTAIIAFVVTRSINYAFAVPLRESLYIPTINEVRFKSKSWIDGVGTKFAKATASSFNWMVDGMRGAALMGVQSIFFTGTVMLWVVTAYALGRRFERAVERNEVIGAAEVEVK